MKLTLVTLFLALLPAALSAGDMVSLIIVDMMVHASSALASMWISECIVMPFCEDLLLTFVFFM